MTEMTSTPLRPDLVAVDGDEAAAFLQGQVTVDLGTVGETHSMLAAHNTPKGRALAIFRIVAHDGRLLLILPRGEGAALIGSLGRYVLRAKVTLTDVSDAFDVAGVRCVDEAHLPAQVSGLDAPGAAALRDGCTWVRLHDADGPRILALGPAGASFPSAAPGTVADWMRADLAAGIPEIVAATREQFVPQMVNLDLVGGINHTKGCYTGQEIIARTHNLGRIKRRMLHFSASSGTAPAPGSAVVRHDDRDGRSAGTVVRAIALPDGGFDLAAVVRLDEPLDALAVAGSRAPLVRGRWPYDVPELDGTGPV